MLLCFDSGIGGLATLTRILELYPSVPFCYVADTAWVPYGDKDPKQLRTRIDHVLSVVQNQMDIDAIAIACNTAVSAMAPETFKQPGLPIFSVVESTVGALLHHHPLANKVGVLATAVTTQSQIYNRHLAPAKDVIGVPCSKLVLFIEAGLLESAMLQAAIMAYVQPLVEAQVDLVVLGCTHYSFIAAQVQGSIGEIPMIDSAHCLAQTVVHHYQTHGVVPSAAHSCIYVTGDPQSFQDTMTMLPLRRLHGVPVKALPCPVAP